MPNTLLTTKINLPPRRSKTVARPHLLSKLGTDFWGESGFSRRLTLVSAPAGYGKTTLVATWLVQSNLPAAWLSLDEQDNDPALFLAYLIEAIRQIAAGFGDNTLSLLRIPQPPPPQVVWSALVNELASLPTRLVLVLDDYHMIQALPIHQQLSFLLDHQPVRMHLVVITREDPLLPIPRLRARGQVLEIRQDDLRFNTSETADFLRRVMGLQLTIEQVAALEQHTEGWITGLQLAALSMQGRNDLGSFVQDFTGSSRFILDYVIEEVLARIDEDTQDFLLKTSILERFTGDLCDAVVEWEGSQEMLETLERANLFVIPLDQSRTWYRYHRLFDELLRHRLSMKQYFDETGLHQRASQWFEEKGFVSEAIQHAIAAQDWERSAALIGSASATMLKHGELVTLLGWRQQIPEAVVRARPDLGLGFAWAHLLIGQFQAAEELLTHFERMAENIPPLMGQVANAQAYLARSRGDNEELIQKSKLVLELLPESALVDRGILFLNLGLGYWHEGRLAEAIPAFEKAEKLSTQTGNTYARVTAQIFLARTCATQGRLRRAEELLQKMIQAEGQVPIMALAHYDLGGIYLEWNDLELAGQHAEQGIELSQRTGNIEFENAGHILKSRILLADRDYPAALAEAGISRQQSKGLNLATQAHSLACQAQVELAAGDVGAAEACIAQMAVDADAHSFYRFIGLIRTRLLLAQGDKPAARVTLDECLAKARAGGWGYAVVVIRTLQVLAAEKKELALLYLDEALKMAQPEGFIRTFLEAGPSLVPLLLEEASLDGVGDYARQILETFDTHFAPSLPPDARLVEPLSGRELEVLRLLGAGLSNLEISERLFVSLGTVKTHLHHIYGKLEVTTRTQALARAEKLRLIG
jgi:LuxR family maltose regulon positive regulatory protein